MIPLSLGSASIDWKNVSLSSENGGRSKPLRFVKRKCNIEVENASSDAERPKSAWLL